MTEREILYWLSSVACAGRKTIRTLLENADPLSGLFEFDSETLELLQVPEELRSQLRDPEKAADETRRAMKRDRDIGIRFLTFRDPDWPERLSLIPDPPLWLHVRGSVPAAEEQTAAIIGSRGADIYGLRMAEFISRELAVRKISVISGMADGIDGLTAAEQIKRKHPKIKIILTTSAVETTWEDKAKAAGIDSFWYKEYENESLIDLMDRTMAGESVYPDDPPQVSFGRVTRADLTERELDILRGLTESLSNDEIAQRLHISPNTVKRHIQNIMEKTGFDSRLELAMNAKFLGLVVSEKQRTNSVRYL